MATATKAAPKSTAAKTPLNTRNWTAAEISHAIYDAIDQSQIDVVVADTPVARMQGLTPIAISQYRQIQEKARGAHERAGSTESRKKARDAYEQAKSDGLDREESLRIEIEERQAAIEEIQFEVQQKRRRYQDMVQANRELRNLRPPLMKDNDDRIKLDVRRRFKSQWQEVKDRVGCLKEIIALSNEPSTNLLAFREVKLAGYYGPQWRELCPFYSRTDDGREIRTHLSEADWLKFQANCETELPEAQRQLDELESAIQAACDAECGTGFWAERFA